MMEAHITSHQFVDVLFLVMHLCNYTKHIGIEFCIRKLERDCES